MPTLVAPQATIEEYKNVTAESLVGWVSPSLLETARAKSLQAEFGGIPDADDISDEAEMRRVKLLNAQASSYLLGLVQQQPKPAQMLIYSEVAAKYLPELVRLWRERPQAQNAAAELLNTTTTTAYFVRYMRSPAAAGLVGMQAKRIAEQFDTIATYTADDVASLGQFLSTLLLLQGDEEVETRDKEILVRRMPEWQTKYPGRLAKEVAERCLGIFREEQMMMFMTGQMKKMLSASLEKCGGPGCTKMTRQDGTELLQCSRCKSAVYCSVEHQKAAWASHKKICFSPAF
ncbi:hypothetical protein HMN09_00168100 [Mycena chlorophos]|uniref:MYND-type domain-containing protein n=1 Tax=Mycena chlorophos TaxID=658473 RepID=A0A8H6TQ80_MYCCL|nr:hypothetical protein HMN09_00168100 [Mycena chlorophos]